jgi:site-specific recombinase XerD
LDWVSLKKVDVRHITPGLVGDYFDELELAIPTKKLHLSAIRRFFDVMVQRHVVVINPALSVRMERYSVVEGRTPEITTAQARHLLDSIEVRRAVDFRDRAVIATLVYTAARAGAIARLKIKDWKDEAGQPVLCFHEKGGKQRRIPVRHDLQGYLADYLDIFALDRKKVEGPLFRTIRDELITDRGMTGVDICRMVKRRLEEVDLPAEISPHSFRSCAATDLLKQGVPLEDVQHLLGHSDARVTRLYDRRQRIVTRNIVERISV